jgi:hypothetical protein
VAIWPPALFIKSLSALNVGSFLINPQRGGAS